MTDKESLWEDRWTYVQGVLEENATKDLRLSYNGRIRSTLIHRSEWPTQSQNPTENLRHSLKTNVDGSSQTKLELCCLKKL